MTRRDKILSPSTASITASADQGTRLEATFSQMSTNPEIAVATLHAGFFEAAFSATQRRVNRDPLPDMESLHPFPNCLNFSKQFVPRNHRQLKIGFRCRHRLPLQKAQVATADAGNPAFDDHPILIRQIRDRCLAQFKMGQTRQKIRRGLARDLMAVKYNRFHTALLSTWNHVCKSALRGERNLGGTAHRTAE